MKAVFYLSNVTYPQSRPYIVSYDSFSTISDNNFTYAISSLCTRSDFVYLKFTRVSNSNLL